MRRFMACRVLERVEKSDSPVVEKESYQADFVKPGVDFACPVYRH